MKINALIMLLFLFGPRFMHGAAKELRELRENCFRLALDQFKHGTNELYKKYVDALNVLCVDYNNQHPLSKANEQLEFLLWRGLIKGQEKALKMILDFVMLNAVANKNEEQRKEMIACLRELGQEKCWMEQLGAATSAKVAGLATLGGVAVGQLVRKPGISRSQKAKLQTDWNTLVQAEEAHSESFKNVQVLLRQKASLKTVNEAMRKTDLLLEQVEKAAAPVEAVLGVERRNIPISSRAMECIKDAQVVSDSRTTTALKYGIGSFVVVVGALMLEALYHDSASRKEKKEWADFKKNNSYRYALALLLNKSLASLEEVNNKVKVLFDQTWFNDDFLLRASLRDWVENLNEENVNNRVRKLFGYKTKNEQFDCILDAISRRTLATPKGQKVVIIHQGAEENRDSLDTCGFEKAWEIGRKREDFSLTVYMQPLYQAKVWHKVLIDLSKGPWWAWH
jgi:hypothetical protein